MGSLKTIGDLIAPDGIFTDGDWVESKDQDPSGTVRLIQLADIGDGTFINKSSRFMTEAKAEKLKCTFLQKGDILVARMPDPIGRACIFPGIGQKAVTVVDVCVIRPNNSEVYPPFLKFLINNDVFRREINRHVTGTTRKRISRKNLNKIEFELPSLIDQKRIAQILENCEKLVTKRKLSISLLSELLSSTYHQMFVSVSNKEKWTEYTFDNIADKSKKGTFSNGPFGSDLLSSELTDEGVPVIYIRDLKNNSFDWISNVFVTHEKAKKLSNCQVISGDVLIAKVGSPPGSAAIYPNGLGMSIITQDVIRLRLNKKRALPSFIQYWLNSEYGRFKLKRIIVEGTRQRFGLGEFKKLKIDVPPIDLQIKFKNTVEAVERIRTKYNESLTYLLELQSSLGVKCFSADKKERLNLDDVLIQETRTFSTDTKESPDSFKVKLENEPIDIQPRELDPNRKKVDISKMTYLDFIGMPEDIQMEYYASDYSVETDFVEEELFWQFFLKDRYQKEPFDVDQVEADFNDYFIPKGVGFNYEIYKKHLFKFIELDPPIVHQYFDENDNRIKLRLTDEAFKA